MRIGKRRSSGIKSCSLFFLTHHLDVIGKKISRLRWNQRCHFMFSGDRKWILQTVRGKAPQPFGERSVLVRFAGHQGFGSKAQDREWNFHAIGEDGCGDNTCTETCVCSLMRINLALWLWTIFPSPFGNSNPEIKTEAPFSSPYEVPVYLFSSFTPQGEVSHSVWLRSVEAFQQIVA